MKKLIAILFVVGAISYFASDASAQCYRNSGYSGGYHGGGVVYRPSTSVYYRSGPSYGYHNRGITPAYGYNVYRSHPYGYASPQIYRQPRHYHGHANRGSFYYRGSNLGIGIRF